MHIRRLSGILLFVLGPVVVLFGQELSDLLARVPGDLRQELLRNGSVERLLDDADDVALVPDHPLAREFRRALDDTNPNVLSEQLVLVRSDLDDRDVLSLFNSLRQVSELSYVQYYNERTEETQDLFRESRAIADPRSRRVIADPVVSTLPRDERIWVLQGLPPFGEIVSEYRYRSDGRAFLFTGTNDDPLPYRGMRVVKPGNMITAILVIPGEDYVLMYGLGGVKAFMMFGLLDNRIEAAFSGRTNGIFDWYYDTYLAPLDR